MKKKPISKSGDSIGLSFEQMFKESDRGCVLLVGSLVEGHLETIHKVQMDADKPEKKKIFEKLTGPFGPLSNFAGKIQIAYGYGLIDKPDYQDLEIIRKLRNEAAHAPFHFAMEDAGITNCVNQLTAYSRIKNSDKWPVIKGVKTLTDSHAQGQSKRCLLLNAFSLMLILESKRDDIKYARREREAAP